MLSLFGLSILGAFGVSNAIGDMSDRAEGEPDWRGDAEDDLHGAFGDELDGDADLIEHLEAFAPGGTDMKPAGAPGIALPGPAPADPGSEAEADEAFAAAFAGPEAVAGDGLAQGDGAQPVAAGAGDAEVIALSVDLPGDGTSDPDGAAAGFRTTLVAGDELTLNIAPDLPGQLVAVHAVYDADPGEDRVHMATAINFYLQPDGAPPPEGQVTGSETEFMRAFGLQKLGTIDMGRLEAHLDPETGDVVITEDSRQSELPVVIGNRDMAELSAVFN